MVKVRDLLPSDIVYWTTMTIMDICVRFLVFFSIHLCCFHTFVCSLRVYINYSFFPRCAFSSVSVLVHSLQPRGNILYFPFILSICFGCFRIFKADFWRGIRKHRKFIRTFKTSYTYSLAPFSRQLFRIMIILHYGCTYLSKDFFLIGRVFCFSFGRSSLYEDDR